MPKLQQPQRPPQAQQPPTNGASAESTINEFTSLLIQTASHGGFRYLQGLWKDNQELQQKYDEKHGAYKVNLKQLNASEAELESTKDALNSLKAEKAATDVKLQETKDDRDKFRQKSHEASEKQNSLLIRGNKLQKQIEALEKGLREAKGEIEEGLKLQGLLRKEQFERQNVQDEVNRLTSFSASMVEYDEVKRDTFHAELERIFNIAYDLAARFLFQDIDMTNVTSMDWSRMREAVLYSSSLPLPMSNTVPAKHMRFAVGLSVLAYWLTKHVFQPIYISEDQDETARLLTKIENRDQEVHVRSVLLQIQDKACGQTRANKAAQEVLKSIKPFVPSLLFGQCEEEIEKVCTQALDVWSSVQHLTELVVANFKPTMAPTEEGLDLPEPPSKTQATREASRKGDGPNKGGPSQPKSGGTQNQTRASPDSSAPSSSEEAVYHIWPEFSTSEETIYPSQFLTWVQVRPAMNEFRREETKRKETRTSNRRNSDASSTMHMGKKNGTNPPFLTAGNGDGSPKA
ncbi:unnamed protein product [Clonostachys rosea f. rosea IK726]|uniref:MEI5 protein n=3 Tax=Bionectria ochroleuca TaxID=29856 RepID=A0A0B7K448_BIOOC|nr:unnamed protein product [Clonostachys rosea f. rosea IK726]